MNLAVLHKLVELPHPRRGKLRHRVAPPVPAIAQAPAIHPFTFLPLHRSRVRSGGNGVVGGVGAGGGRRGRLVDEAEVHGVYVGLVDALQGAHARVGSLALGLCGT